MAVDHVDGIVVSNHGGYLSRGSMCVITGRVVQVVDKSTVRSPPLTRWTQLCVRRKYWRHKSLASSRYCLIRVFALAAISSRRLRWEHKASYVRDLLSSIISNHTYNRDNKSGETVFIWLDDRRSGRGRADSQADNGRPAYLTWTLRMEGTG